jgi:glycosyltransferase involved in cell wall biosynthesis
MRVLQLISSLKTGGAQKLQETFVGAVRGRPVELTVASLQADAGSTILEALQAQGQRVVHLPGKKLLDVGRFQKLLRFLRQEKFDVIQSHLTYANILAAAAGRLTGIPVIGTLHNVRIEAKHYHPLREGLMETLALRFGARAVIAVGEQVAEAYRPRLRGQRLVVIPNAVAPIPPLPAAERLALRRSLTGSTARPLLLAVGRLSVQKGFADLLDAFAEIHAAHPDAFLAIAGAGELQGELTARLEWLGLAGHASLLGGRGDVPQLLRASDIFVSSSLWEGLPIAVLEAMSAGLPVVATQVGEVPFTVVEGTGLLVPPGQPQHLAAALQTLLADSAKREAMGRAALAHVERHHSPGHWLDQHLTLYRDVTRRAGQPVPQPDAP